VEKFFDTCHNRIHLQGKSFVDLFDVWDTDPSRDLRGWMISRSSFETLGCPFRVTTSTAFSSTSVEEKGRCWMK
jgi:hypothetical protein